jgi:hypothetical protein
LAVTILQQRSRSVVTFAGSLLHRVAKWRILRAAVSYAEKKSNKDEKEIALRYSASTDRHCISY